MIRVQKTGLIMRSRSDASYANYHMKIPSNHFENKFLQLCIYSICLSGHEQKGSPCPISMQAPFGNIQNTRPLRGLIVSVVHFDLKECVLWSNLQVSHFPHHERGSLFFRERNYAKMLRTSHIARYKRHKQRK